MLLFNYFLIVFGNASIAKNPHPDGSARHSCIKIRSVFPLHKHTPTLTSLICTSTEESSVHTLCGYRIIKPKLYSASSSQGMALNLRQCHSTASLRVSRAAKRIKQPLLQERLDKACRPRSRFFFSWNHVTKRKK